MSLLSRLYHVLRSRLPAGREDSAYFSHDCEEAYKESSRQSHTNSAYAEKNRRLAESYAMLEIPYGSDRKTAKKALRELLKKYHPDRHAHSPEKQKTATTISMELTQAYKIIEEELRKNTFT